MLFSVQYPLYKELFYMKWHGGPTPGAMRVLWTLDYLRGSSTLINPHKLCKASAWMGLKSITNHIKELRDAGYITKLSKFEYRFENKAINFVKAFNERMEIKTRAYFDNIPWLKLNP
jgi:hypothetical protein